MREKASLVAATKVTLTSGHILQMRVWELPEPTPERPHGYKYSLFFGRPGERIVGFDNERGKGDHMHRRHLEAPYVFTSLDKLVDDFLAEVRKEMKHDRGTSRGPRTR